MNVVINPFRYVHRLAICMVALCAAASGATTDPQATRYVWWEAEDFAATNLPHPRQSYPADITPEERAQLSGDAWIHTAGPPADQPYFLTYTVTVPESGRYGFWARKFWRHGPFRWRFDDQEWRICGRDIALMDETHLRLHIGANWVYLGNVKLESGQRTLRIEMLDRGGGGCLDAFVLIDGPFVPRGKLKPDEKSGAAAPGYFAWEPPPDPLNGDSLIDLRHLNEAEAGQSGFVRREGGGFVLGDGEPVRFWIVQGDALVNMHPDIQDEWARRLAKYGVNMVRFGAPSFQDWRGGNLERFQQRLDQLHRAVAALKRQGIYSYLGHLWWDTSGGFSVSEADGFAGYSKGTAPLALLFFDPRMRELYLDWVDALLNRDNPHTGLPLARDPAVAFVEIQNETSLFFWTFHPDRIVPQTRHLIEQRFGAFATARYGSIDAALEAWGPDRHPSRVWSGSVDHPAAGRLGLYPIGQLTLNDWAAAQRNPRRAADQLAFMAGWQRRFYEDMIHDWREKLGVRTLIATSNWKTADPRNLGVLERYSYTAGDVICRNTYFDVRYDPPAERFYAIDVGDTYTEHSALKPPMFPEPFTIARINNHPDMYTENNWCRPNRYRAEWPFLVAAYGPMIGMDGWTFFSLDSAAWTSQMRVWEVNSPTVLGQFPAAALIFRSGHVREAPAAVTQRMTLEELHGFGRAVLSELTGRDALWVARIGELEGAVDRDMTVDPLAFFVGRVDRIIGDVEPGVETVDLSRYIDAERRTVRSLTGEQRWDYGTGIVTLDTPRAQGVCGFLGAGGRIELGDVIIESGNEYGSILIVSLDGQSLAKSGRILIQAATEDLPHGFRTESVEDKQRITHLGGYPMNVRQIDATVTLHGAADRRVTILDGNGHRTERQAQISRDTGRLAITLPRDSLYVVVE
jgi:hypothetical protein